MARALVMASWDPTINLSAGEFVILGSAALNPTGAPEAQHQVKIGTAGHFCFLGAQTPSAPSGQALRLRKNGSDGTQVTPLTAGWAQSTDQDTVVSGDLISFAIESGAGTAGVATVRTVYSADTGTGTVYAAWFALLVALNSTSHFPLAGSIFTGGALPEADVQTKFSVPGTLSYLQCYVSSNPASGDGALKLNVNGVTKITLTIPAGATGLLVNTSDTWTVADGDLVSLELVTGTGAGNMGFTFAAASFLATSGDATDVFGTTAFRTGSFTGTIYFPLSGYGTGQSTESNTTVRVGFPSTASRFAFYVEQNTCVADCTVNIRISGLDGTLTKTVPAGATGWFEDSIHSDVLLATADVGLAATNPGAAGVLGITTTRVRITDNGGGDTCNGPVPPTVVYGVPGLIGCAYTSRAQLLRPDYGNDAGAQAGPAFGKKRRIHQYGAYLFRTRVITFGTNFDADRQHDATLTTTEDAAPETAIGVTDLFTGITSQNIADDYSWTGQIAWEQARPTPGTILAVAGYLETSEK